MARYIFMILLKQMAPSRRGCWALSALYPKPVKLPVAEVGINKRGVILYLSLAWDEYSGEKSSI